MAGARVLDLYAGTGILGIEALSGGAAWVDFVEANPRRCRQLRENLRELLCKLSARCTRQESRGS